MESTDVQDEPEMPLPTVIPAMQIVGFTQVYEAAESAVGAEGPLNKTESDTVVAQELLAGEGEDIPPTQPDLLHREASEESAAGARALPLEVQQSKVNETLFTDRVRDFCQSPTTWRVIKGLIVLAVAMKLFQSMDTIEQYLPVNGVESLRDFFGRHG